MNHQLKPGSLHLNPKARRHRPHDIGPLVRNCQRFTQRQIESLEPPTLIGNVRVKPLLLRTQKCLTPTISEYTPWR